MLSPQKRDAHCSTPVRAVGGDDTRGFVLPNGTHLLYSSALTSLTAAGHSQNIRSLYSGLAPTNLNPNWQIKLSFASIRARGGGG